MASGASGQPASFDVLHLPEDGFERRGIALRFHFRRRWARPARQRDRRRPADASIRPSAGDRYARRVTRPAGGTMSVLSKRRLAPTSPLSALNPLPAPAAALVFTGERFTPESRGAIWYEHWHRYCVVAELARGRRVLDAACGEGYGSALIAREAVQVVGVDVGTDAIAHAKSRYSMPNLSYVRGSV